MDILQVSRLDQPSTTLSSAQDIIAALNEQAYNVCADAWDTVNNIKVRAWADRQADKASTDQAMHFTYLMVKLPVYEWAAVKYYYTTEVAFAQLVDEWSHGMLDMTSR